MPRSTLPHATSRLDAALAIWAAAAALTVAQGTPPAAPAGQPQSKASTRPAKTEGNAASAAEQDRAFEAANDLDAKGDSAAALAAAEKGLALEAQAKAMPPNLHAEWLSWAAERREMMESFDVAAKHRQAAFELLRQFRGEEHWQTADARRALTRLDALRQFTAEKRQQVRKANESFAQAKKAYQANDFQEAARKCEATLDLRRAVWGEIHPDVAHAWLNLGDSCHKAGDTRRSLTLMQKSLEIRQATLGDDHPETADAATRTAFVHAALGEDAAALKLYQTALRMYLKSRGEMHLDTVQCLRSVAESSARTGDRPLAIRTQRRALDLLRKLSGESDVETVAAIRELARLLRGAGETAEADTLSTQALRIERDQAFASAQTLDAKGELAAAIAAAEKALAIERQLKAAKPDGLAFVLSWTADRLERTEALDAAAKHRQEALRLLQGLRGEKHWQTADARRAIERLEAQRRFTPEKRRQWFAAQELLAKARRASAAKDLKQAIALTEKSLELRQSVWGDSHAATADGVFYLSLLHDRIGDWRRALPLAQQAWHIRREALGEAHPDTAWSANNTAVAHHALGGDAAALKLHQAALRIRSQCLGEEHLDTAASMSHVAAILAVTGKAPEAVQLQSQALQAVRKLRGESDAQTAQALHDLGRFHGDAAEYGEAEKFLHQAYQLRLKLFGPRHAATAESLHGQGWLLFAQRGDLDRAKELISQALSIRLENLGRRHLSTAKNYADLGDLHIYMGDYVRAAELHAAALDVRADLLGNEHPYVARSRRDLGRLAYRMHDDAKAERLLSDAWQGLRRAYGEESPSAVGCMAELGDVHVRRGRFADAEPLLRRALELSRRSAGDATHTVMDNLNKLAALYLKAGDLPRAQSHLQEAASLAGKCDCCRANCLVALGRAYQRQGLRPDAEKNYQQAVEVAVRGHGPRHPHTAECYQALAEFYAETGRLDRAKERTQQALEVRRLSLDLNFTAQSERQQIVRSAALRDSLDLYATLAADPQGTVTPEDLYAQVLAWKGAVAARQSGAPRPEPDSAASAEHREVCSRLASMFHGHPPVDERRAAYLAELERLNDRKERLEVELHPGGDHALPEWAAHRVTPAQLRDALPNASVLLDFLEYASAPVATDERGAPTRHLLCFVVRPERPVTLVPLGPAETVALSIDEWRHGLQQRAVDEPKLAAAVRERLWTKLAEYVAGADTIFVSPDGAVARCPFSALPGRREGQRLLEEAAVVIAPNPRSLAARPPRKSASPAGEPPSLLVVGNVDFGANVNATDAQLAEPKVAKHAKTRGERQAADRSAARWGERGMLWDPLPGTEREISQIATVFAEEFKRSATRLESATATEAAWRREASRHRFLHVATHGFFASPQTKSILMSAGQRGLAPLDEPSTDKRFGDVLPGFHPGLLSGIVMAGANHVGQQPAGKEPMSKEPPSKESASKEPASKEPASKEPASKVPASKVQRPEETAGDDGIVTAVEVAALDLHETELVVLSACETGLGATAGGEGMLGLQRAFQTAGAKATIATLWRVHDDATQQLMATFYENLWRKGKAKGEALRQAQLALLHAKEADHRHPYYWAGFLLSGDER